MTRLRQVWDCYWHSYQSLPLLTIPLLLCVMLCVVFSIHPPAGSMLAAGDPRENIFFALAFGGVALLIVAWIVGATYAEMVINYYLEPPRSRFVEWVCEVCTSIDE